MTWGLWGLDNTRTAGADHECAGDICAHPACRPDLPPVMYHGTWQRNRPSITEHGLLTEHSEDEYTPALYMSPSPERPPYEDVWAIDTSKLRHLEDDSFYMDEFDDIGGSYCTQRNVPPEAMKLHRPATHRLDENYKVVSLTPHTAARTAMPTTYYHITNNPNFKLDPKVVPYNQNERSRPGIFLTENPDNWAQNIRADRPYMAEFEGPDDLYKKPGTDWYVYDDDKASDELFVPPEHFHHLKLKNFGPRNKKANLMTAAITVYTKPDCPQCTMTKKQLDKLGIEHTTVDVTVDPDAHAYVTGLGYQQAPVVVVNDGERHWAGFSPDKLKGLVE